MALLWRGARVTSSFAYANRSVNIIPRAFIEVWDYRKGPNGEYITEKEYWKQKTMQRLAFFPEETRKWLRERHDYIRTHRGLDVNIIPEHNDYEVLWRFNTEQDLQEWIVTSDTSNKEGTSSANFRLGQHKTGLFSGYLSTKPPKEGLLKQTGYVNICSKGRLKSYFREDNMDWRNYTHLLIRCRGDGRAYMLNVHMDRYYDVQWHDTYSYPLYTRGGPYWQLTKIPMTKLVLSSKGRVQDDQSEVIDSDRVSCLGITCTDTFNGPFSLELDFIALVHDENHRGETEYEGYNVPLSFHY